MRLLKNNGKNDTIINVVIVNKVGGTVMITKRTKGVCAGQISVKLSEGKIEDVVFHGGCGGNTSGLQKLLVGLNKDEVITKLSGIDCGGRGTSCPDQLAKILKEME